MLPSIRASSSQGRDQWQRLSASSLLRQRQERHLSVISGSKSTKSTIIRRYPVVRRSFSSALAIPPAPSSLLFKSPSVVVTQSWNRVAVSRTKLIRYSSSANSQVSSTSISTSTSADAVSAEAAAKISASGNGEGGDNSSSSSYFGALFKRLAMSLGIVYVVTEYGIEWTVCEGPSMMPTIKPRGEIVVIDRFTPQLWGMKGGDTVSKRTAFAKRSQEAQVQDRKRKKKKDREWLLRLYQQEEEKVVQRNHQLELQGKEEQEQGQGQEQEPFADNGNKMKMGREETGLTQQQSTPMSTTTNFSDSSSKVALLEQESQSPSGINTNRNISSSSSEEILQALREDLEKMGDDDDDEETWYETRIPVNKLPPEGTWDRFRTQITTGISVGDVVVLQHPDRIGTVCKRVSGLPGDIVTKPSSRLGADRMEALLHGGGGASRRSQESPPLFLDDDQERRRRNRRNKRRRRLLSSGIQVPDGHIWVEGDNPWNSSDSRNYGAVPASLIMGRVLCRLWPLRGNALMERGDRPVRSEDDELSLAFSGSIVIPAGWDDQRIVREFVPVSSPVSVVAEPPTMTEHKHK